MIEFPVGDQILHADGVIAGAQTVVHVQLVGLHDLLTVHLDAQAALLGQVDAAVNDLHGRLGQAVAAFLPYPVGVDAVHLAGDGSGTLHDHNLKILFDPVNLLSMENVDAREEIIAEAIELLGMDVAMIHFKDYLLKDAGGQLAATGAGLGHMDYTQVLRFAKKEKPFIHGTLENTTPENASACLKFLQDQYAAIE